MYDLLPSRSEKDFVRDPSNPGALVNTNNKALADYKKIKRSFSRLSRVEGLEQRLNRIEALLEQLINK